MIGELTPQQVNYMDAILTRGLEHYPDNTTNEAQN